MIIFHKDNHRMIFFLMMFHYKDLSTSTSNTTIDSVQQIQRIQKELVAIMHDTEYGKSFIFIPTDNLKISYFILIGQKNTPYYLGLYLFKSIYPDEYPSKPPIVHYYSNCKYRQNPNLYCGKVCL